MSSLVDLFDLYRLPPGRRLFALRKTRNLVEPDPMLVPLIETAMAKDTEALELRAQWVAARSKTPKYPPRLFSLDLEHDRLLGSMSRITFAVADALGPETNQGAAARRVAEGAFTGGLPALTQLDFVQQRESTKVLLDRLNGPLAADIVTLGLAAVRDRLVAVNDEFGTILDAYEPEARMTFDRFRQEDLTGQEMMLRVVAVIAGRYNGATAGDDATRANLLAPILQQNAAVAESFRRKRSITDVNPNNGEDEPVPVE